MSGHALEVLELGRVLESVARRASSVLGRERILALRPRTARADIVAELARVSAVMGFLEERPDWGLGSLPDARGALGQLATEGAVLEPAPLHRVGVLLETSRRLQAELGQASGEQAPLEALRARLVDLREVEEDIVRSVDAEGSVLNTASRDLKRIRDRLRGAHAKVVRALEGYMGSLPERYLVADASVTIRDGRYVVPIRREGKGEVGGIVHGESQTGATLFVEPPVAIELMNGLRDLEGEEAREIRRILRALTSALAPHAEALAGALDALVEFDTLEARARTAGAWRASVPQMAERGERALHIREGRHPLLIEAAEGPVVPFDLDLEAEERALVVSGPNTGGKSVFLKATGLVSALAQSGVVPPVGPETSLPVFGAVFADIGDEQSIARNLSTFSAHLANLSDIVAQADATSLVLIDEMGTGTDPAEGAALARAVLEELVARGATTMVTSHLGELKRLDTEGSGIVYASLQFDPERMEPTYRLVKGRPGRSYGLAIARRLGFPGDVLDRAEAHREHGAAELEELLARLEREEHEARELARRLDLERAETGRLRADLEDRERDLREAERTSETRAREEARQLLLDARAEVEAAIRELKGSVAEGDALEEAAREARRKVERAAGRQRAPVPGKAAPGEAPTLSPGDAVRITATGSRGKLVELRDDRALVEAGALRLEVPLRELEPAQAGVAAPQAGRGSGWRRPPSEPRIEVDLRGMRVDEVEAELVRALDEALLGDLPELRIIHGKGTGALRQRVGELLEADGRVSDFRMGGPREGGAGVTVARFKR
ncbi:MAG TPA: endonuclease MutS2 [Longimicrobiales bacterium]|nr:endonuclease MutS2 [Longimicrobiales bacterium]